MKIKSSPGEHTLRTTSTLGAKARLSCHGGPLWRHEMDKARDGHAGCKTSGSNMAVQPRPAFSSFPRAVVRGRLHACAVCLRGARPAAPATERPPERENTATHVERMRRLRPYCDMDTSHRRGTSPSIHSPEDGSQQGFRAHRCRRREKQLRRQLTPLTSQLSRRQARFATAALCQAG